jgi:hypothetical protein
MRQKPAWVKQTWPDGYNLSLRSPPPPIGMIEQFTYKAVFVYALDSEMLSVRRSMTRRKKTVEGRDRDRSRPSLGTAWKYSHLRCDTRQYGLCGLQDSNKKPPDFKPRTLLHDPD